MKLVELSFFDNEKINTCVTIGYGESKTFP